MKNKDDSEVNQYRSENAKNRHIEILSGLNFGKVMSCNIEMMTKSNAWYSLMDFSAISQLIKHYFNVFQTPHYKKKTIKYIRQHKICRNRSNLFCCEKLKLNSRDYPKQYSFTNNTMLTQIHNCFPGEASGY